MAKRCDICGKGPLVGHKISHAHNLTKRRWLPNLKKVRANINGHIMKIKVCTRCIKTGHFVKVVQIKKASQ